MKQQAAAKLASKARAEAAKKALADIKESEAVPEGLPPEGADEFQDEQFLEELKVKRDLECDRHGPLVLYPSREDVHRVLLAALTVNLEGV